MEERVHEKLAFLRSFLKNKGLLQDGDLAAGTLKYSDGAIAIRVVPDRMRTYLVVVDEAEPGEWGYDIPVLRDFLTDTEKDDSIPLGDEINFIERHWHDIVESFSVDRRIMTHNILNQRRERRVRERWPDLFKPQ